MVNERERFKPSNRLSHIRLDVVIENLREAKATHSYGLEVDSHESLEEIQVAISDLEKLIEANKELVGPLNTIKNGLELAIEFMPSRVESPEPMLNRDELDYLLELLESHP